eukprot:GHVL01038711.1.p1 GENE.GHVL01038711.1~~GHVL01038711.1.p1  ORF type:complete len:1149 (-),score=242.96 GHVL01038711.1:13-3459(-)
MEVKSEEDPAKKQQASLFSFFSKTPGGVKKEKSPANSPKENNQKRRRSNASDEEDVLKAKRRAVTTVANISDEEEDVPVRGNRLKKITKIPSKNSKNSKNSRKSRSGRKQKILKIVSYDPDFCADSYAFKGKSRYCQELCISSGKEEIDNLSTSDTTANTENMNNSKSPNKVEKIIKNDVKKQVLIKNEVLVEQVCLNGTYLEIMADASTNGKEFPPWCLPGEIKDRNGVRPGKPNYDGSTLWVPKDEKTAKRLLANLQSGTAHWTPAMAQYWTIKSDHFDKVVLFKLGKFYEMVYFDAIIGNKVLDLKWMGHSVKPHVGFPESSLHYQSSRLVAAGYKVVVVEQMETPDEAAKRTGKSSATVQREVCEVFTKGTVTHDAMLGPDASFLLSVWFSDSDDALGICFLDVSTHRMFVGSLGGSEIEKMSSFKTVLSQICPNEIVFKPEDMPLEASKIVSSMPCPPQYSPLGAFSSHPTYVNELVDETFKDCPLSEMQNFNTRVAVAMMVEYLKSILVADKVLKFAHVEKYEPVCQRFMTIDASALQNLEILETQEGKAQGSLFHLLNQTSTFFGGRLFKRWLCSPLTSIDELEKRLSTVDFFKENPQLADQSRKKLKELPDIERSMARVCALGLQAERGAVYFGDVTDKKMREFVEILNSFEAMQAIVDEFRQFQLPTRLKTLTTREQDGGKYPKLGDFILEMKQSLIIDESRQPGSRTMMGSQWVPRLGIDENYDLIVERISKIKNQLEELRESYSKKLKNSAVTEFVHSKFRYEIEVAESAIPSSFKSEVDVTSSRKGYIRFQTDDVRELTADLDLEDQALKDAMYPFMQNLFKRFYEQHERFRNALSCVGEIDVLLSLAKISSHQMCRPKLSVSDSKRGILVLKKCRHPVAELSIDRFVPNDVILNPPTDEKDETSVMIVTGPNMGGKSTLLRQAAICIIMAQVGCYVPADECIMTPVDKLFTRIGGRDAILEGKSTFLVEMEETSSILRTATENSFAIIDELGRGTSTFDGTAIALASLQYIARDIKCRCLFATHFHLLSDEFDGDPNVRNFHMSAHSDQTLGGNVTLLYTLQSGACPSSLGLNVAKVAGLPTQVIESGRQKAEKFGYLTKKCHKLFRLREAVNFFLTDNLDKIMCQKESLIDLTK